MLMISYRSVHKYYWSKQIEALSMFYFILIDAAGYDQTKWQLMVINKKSWLKLIYTWSFTSNNSKLQKCIYMHSNIHESECIMFLFWSSSRWEPSICIKWMVTIMPALLFYSFTSICDLYEAYFLTYIMQVLSVYHFQIKIPIQAI